MKLEIRKADLEDTLALMEILTAAVAYKQQHHDDSWGSEPFSEREVRGLIKAGSMYVALADDEVAATFALSEDDERIWGPQPPVALHIHRLAVKGSYHGHDVGSKLLEWALGEVKRQGRQFLRLDCDARNKELCTYYEKHGFKQVGEKLLPSERDYYANLYERPV